MLEAARAKEIYHHKENPASASHLLQDRHLGNQKKKEGQPALLCDSWARPELLSQGRGVFWEPFILTCTGKSLSQKPSFAPFRLHFPGFHVLNPSVSERILSEGPDPFDF